MVTKTTNNNLSRNLSSLPVDNHFGVVSGRTEIFLIDDDLFLSILIFPKTFDQYLLESVKNMLRHILPTPAAVIRLTTGDYDRAPCMTLDDIKIVAPVMTLLYFDREVGL